MPTANPVRGVGTSRKEGLLELRRRGADTLRVAVRRQGKETGGGRAEGFTLLEVLLALALLSILGGFLVLDWGGLTASFARPSPRESVQETFRSAHYLAERRERPVWIRAAGEGDALEVIDAGSGKTLLRQPIPGLESFAPTPRNGSAPSVRISSLRGSPVDMAVVRIGPEGVGGGARVEIGLAGEVLVLEHDPFSGALLQRDGNPWGSASP